MKIGILGYGSIGSRHARNLRALGHQVAIYDPEFEGTMKREKVLGWAEAFVVASPTSEHASDIADIQSTGGDCFCEKPISDHLTDSLQEVLMVGYNLRFHPAVKKVKEWIADDRIGTPTWANFLCAQFNDKPAYHRDGVVLNWSHEIDLALHLLGPATVTASSISKKEDIADILLVHEGGCRTSIHLDYLTKPEHRGFNIVGSKGTIISHLPGRKLAFVDLDGNVKQVEEYPGSYDDDYIEEMKAFIDRIGGKKTLGCTAQEAIEVLNICLDVKKRK